MPLNKPVNDANEYTCTPRLLTYCRAITMLHWNIKKPCHFPTFCDSLMWYFLFSFPAWKLGVANLHALLIDVPDVLSTSDNTRLESWLDCLKATLCAIYFLFFVIVKKGQRNFSKLKWYQISSWWPSFKCFKLSKLLFFSFKLIFFLMLSHSLCGVHIFKHFNSYFQVYVEKLEMLLDQSQNLEDLPAKC